MKCLPVLAILAAASCLSACDDPGPVKPAFTDEKFLCAPTGEPMPPIMGPHAKGCSTMIFFARDRIGRFIEYRNGMVHLDGLPALDEKTQPVAFNIEDGKLCHAQTRKNAEQTTYTLNGQSLTPDMQARVDEAMRPTVDKIVGKKVCETLTPYGDSLRISTTVDGEPAPELDDGKGYIWGSNAEGYMGAPY